MSALNAVAHRALNDARAVSPHLTKRVVEIVLTVEPLDELHLSRYCRRALPSPHAREAGGMTNARVTTNAQLARFLGKAYKVGKDLLLLIIRLTGEATLETILWLLERWFNS